MSVLDPILEPVRRLSLKGGTMLRASLPPVAVEVTADEVVLVRVKRKGSGRLELESAQARPLVATLPGGLRGPVATEDLAARLAELFASVKVRPGRLSLVLPDSLAKVTLIQLPERPSSARQLDELVRFKLRKAVPFRLDEAAVAWQLLPAVAPEVTVLVAAMPRATLAPYERALASIGARPGLVSLCTPNLFNLWKARMAQPAAGGDVALLNCTPAYFSLLIVREERLIFYRCKPLAAGDESGEAPERVLPRELASSLSYYRDKLGGSALTTAYVRTVSQPFEELVVVLDALGVGRVELVDPTLVLANAGSNGASLDPDTAQRIAPAVGAASGWR
jgi:type IV pilus assembly protein PilM